MMPTRSVVDLYAGAGGLSLGFFKAGFNIAAAVEIDEWAAETFSNNLSVNDLLITSVSSLSPTFFRKYQGVDVLLGGPPCQGFSICASNRRDPGDKRNLHPFTFIETVRNLRPAIVVMENVPDIKRAVLPNGTKVLEEVCKSLVQMGYKLNICDVNAADFGVPQSRQRMFILAAKERVIDLGGQQTHSNDNTGLFKLRPWVTVSEAISDLPSVTPRELAEDEQLQYQVPPRNDYQRYLREGSTKIYNHIPMRHTPRLIERFKAIQVGGRGTDVWGNHSPRRRSSGDKEGTRFEQNHRRLRPDAPAPTITAFCYSTFLHPWEHRNLTVREAARLQSFPDWFRFYGKRTTLSKKLLEKKGLAEDTRLNQVNQVGNAVPPLLAYHIAQAILNIWEK